jgi:hypothetical protein
MRKPNESVKLRIDNNSGIRHCALSVGPAAQEPVARAFPAPDSQGFQESESNQLPTDSFNALSKRELINFLRRKPCHFDDVDLGVLGHSTIHRLKVLRARAREGKCVEEASEFARWVVQAGLLKLLGGKVKGAVQKLASDTLFDCECHWRNQGQGPWVAKSELEAVNAKLDNLAGLVASLAHPGRDRDTASPEPRLIVLPEVPVERGDTARREERAAAGRP